MNSTTIFRLLLVMYVLCYGTALRYQHIDGFCCDELRRYEECLEARFGGFDPDEFRWALLWAAGHLVEVVGLVLLFCRVRFGLLPACTGAALAVGVSWFFAQPDSCPNLQTTTDGLLWSATCILWGGYVCMALTDRQNIFARASNP